MLAAQQQAVWKSFPNLTDEVTLKGKFHINNAGTFAGQVAANRTVDKVWKAVRILYPALPADNFDLLGYEVRFPNAIFENWVLSQDIHGLIEPTTGELHFESSFTTVRNPDGEEVPPVLIAQFSKLRLGLLKPTDQKPNWVRHAIGRELGPEDKDDTGRISELCLAKLALDTARRAARLEDKQANLPSPPTYVVPGYTFTLSGSRKYEYGTAVTPYVSEVTKPWKAGIGNCALKISFVIERAGKEESRLADYVVAVSRTISINGARKVVDENGTPIIKFPS